MKGNDILKWIRKNLRLKCPLTNEKNKKKQTNYSINEYHKLTF